MKARLKGNTQAMYSTQYYAPCIKYIFMDWNVLYKHHYFSYQNGNKQYKLFFVNWIPSSLDASKRTHQLHSSKRHFGRYHYLLTIFTVNRRTPHSYKVKGYLVMRHFGGPCSIWSGQLSVFSKTSNGPSLLLFYSFYSVFLFFIVLRPTNLSLSTTLPRTGIQAVGSKLSYHWYITKYGKTLSSQTLFFEARRKCRVGYIHSNLASSYANAPQPLASSPSTVGFITRYFTR